MALLKRKNKKENQPEVQGKRKRSLVDKLYVKFLRDPSTNTIISIVSFVFIIWMVVPLFLILSGSVYFDGQWSTQPIENVFTDPIYFNFGGDKSTLFYERSIETIGGPAVSVVASNNLLYTAERGDGIEILDISDPYAVIEICQYDDENSSFIDLEIRDSLLFAAAGENGLIIFNTTDTPVTKTLSVISQTTLDLNATDFLTVHANLAILGKRNEGFTIVNITDVENPSILSHVDVETDSYEIAVSGNYAFLVGYTTGIKIFDISNPLYPSELVTYSSFPGIGTLTTYGISLVNELAFVTLGNKGLASFNTTNLLNLTLVSRLESIKPYLLNVVENFAYVTVVDDLNFEYGIKIINISDPESMVEEGGYISAHIRTQDIYVDNEKNQIYLAQEGYGSYILDSNILTNLEVIATYEDTEEITTHIFSGVNRGVVLNTLILGISTTILSIILGTGLAFILARYEFPGKRIISLLSLAPLIIPPFISGMGFRLLLGPSGFLNNMVLVPLFGSKIIITGFVAICFVQTSHFFALVYLNAFSSFVNIDPSMEEQAENLGAKGFKIFRSVTFPLAMPGIGAGAILVLILSMEDVGTPIIFANMGDTMATKYLTYFIFQNYSRGETDIITPEVCVLGTILLIVAMIGFFAIRRYISLKKYAMVSKGRAGVYRLAKAKWKLTIFYPFFIILFSLSLLVHMGVFLMSIMKRLGPTDPSQIEFTFEYYGEIFSTQYDVFPYILNTLKYSILATLLIVVLGTLAAYVVSRKEFRGKSVLDGLVTIPIAIPGIVLALGYYRAFDFGGIAYRNPNWFTLGLREVTETLRLDPFIPAGAITLLVLSYTIRKFPFTVRSAFAGLQQMDPVLEEASVNLGAGRMKTFTKVTVPMISLNVFAGTLVSFIYCLSEVSTTIFLIMQEKHGTLTWFMAFVSVRFQLFCALGVLLMLLQIFSLFITNVILGSRAEAITGI